MKLLILMIFLISCTRSINCYSLQNYSIEQQKELITILQKNNNATLNKFIIDYYNLRKTVKVCK